MGDKILMSFCWFHETNTNYTDIFKLRIGKKSFFKHACKYLESINVI